MAPPRQTLPISEQLMTPVGQARLLGLLLDGASSLVGLKDLKHRYLFANQQLETLYGVPHGGMVGITSEAYVPAENVSAIHGREDSVILDGKPAHFLEKIIINGLQRTWETIRFPFRDLQGKIAGSGFVAIDIADGETLSDAQRETLARTREQAISQTAGALPGSTLKPKLPLLVWRASYECGNPTIDRQHQALFKKSNLLLNAAVSDLKKSDITSIMTDFLNDIRQHFHDEESVISQAGYTHVDEHHDIHLQLETNALKLIHQFETDQLLVEDLFRFLTQEVVAKHILQHDREYFAFINKHFPMTP